METRLELVDVAVVDDEVIGHSDWTAFFHVFDFAIVAVTDCVRVEGSIRALCDTSIAEFFRGNDGDKGECARECMQKLAIFGPRIEAVEDDAFLTGSDKIFGLGDSLFRDPIFTFGFANHLAECFFTFSVRSAFDVAFCHFAVNHVPEMNFGEAVVC